MKFAAVNDMYYDVDFLFLHRRQKVLQLIPVRDRGKFLHVTVVDPPPPPPPKKKIPLHLIQNYIKKHIIT